MARLFRCLPACVLHRVPGVLARITPIRLTSALRCGRAAGVRAYDTATLRIEHNDFAFYTWGDALLPGRGRYRHATLRAATGPIWRWAMC